MPAPAPPGSYLICATPRTGSTLLCGLLTATAIAGKPESYFRLEGELTYAEKWGIRFGPGGPLDYEAYVRAAVVAGSSTNGVFGGRVMWETMGEVVGKLRAACHYPLGSDVDVLERVFGRTRFVHLRRRDVVAQAVSWARAEQTGYWQDGQVAKERPRFAFNEVHGYFRTINEHNAAWRRWFGSSGVVPLEVVYEDVVADMADATRAILRFLELDLQPGHVVAAGTRRQADEVNYDWARRYRTLKLLGP